MCEAVAAAMVQTENMFGQIVIMMLCCADLRRMAVTLPVRGTECLRIGGELFCSNDSVDRGHQYSQQNA